jgi:hypothetical protein
VSDILIACAVVLVPAALLVYLEYRSRPRDDAKTRGLAAANRGLPDDGKGEGN